MVQLLTLIYFIFGEASFSAEMFAELGEHAAVPIYKISPEPFSFWDYQTRVDSPLQLIIQSSYVGWSLRPALPTFCFCFRIIVLLEGPNTAHRKLHSRGCVSIILTRCPGPGRSGYLSKPPLICVAKKLLYILVSSDQTAWFHESHNALQTSGDVKVPYVWCFVDVLTPRLN